MDLNKHIVTNDSVKPFHSNGFAQIVNGDRIGSVGKSTFEQRQQINQNRRLIYGYNRSAMGNTYGALRVKPVIANTDISKAVNTSLQQHNSLSSGSQRFREPPTRGYNPYS